MYGEMATQHLLLAVLLFGIVAFQSVTGQYSRPTSSSKCRCNTNDVCFPGTEELNNFNASLGGRLIIPRPTAWQCYPSNLNQTFCDILKVKSSDGIFRSTIAGSMQDYEWEENGMQRCPMETASTPGSQCQQGRVPIYGVDAASVSDAQKTILFASQHNLRLSVKNTGHDILGRSGAIDSFMLWMHNLNSIKVDMAFQQQGCNRGGPAVTISGGVHWQDAYTAVSTATNDQYVVVGGMCPSVGASGGYVLGGGHSPLSPTYGLAVDNVLQYEIILADGTLHVVNDCQEPDLFWALRGGGGSTFGVMTSVTYQLQPNPKELSSFQVTVGPSSGNLTAAQLLQVYTAGLSFLNQWDDARWAGYIQLDATVGFVGTFLIPQNKQLTSQLTDSFSAAFKSMTDAGIVTIKSNTSSQPSFYQWKANHIWPGADFDSTGLHTTYGTRLIPKSALTDGQMVTTFFSSGTVPQIVSFLIWLISGQGVRERDANSQSTSVTPAWRKSALQAGVQVLWSYDTPDSEIQSKVAALQSALDILRKAYPDSGAYVNEANIEPNWQQQFWGNDNYARLLKVKHSVDPNGLFYCKQCVGSEEWDALGNCKLMY